MTEIDTISDTDLDAYVDNQLDSAGRLQVETWLARHPDVAARVMADLGTRTMLKLALTSDEAGTRADSREIARRLSSGLYNRSGWNALRRVAAVAVLISAGWLANSSIGPFGAGEVNASVPPPSFIADAVRAHQTALVRESMPSQPQTSKFDREDIRAATAIRLPQLPANWTVSDVQIFPSDFGPSVEMRVETDDKTRLSLFAVRPGYFAVNQVSDVQMSDAEAAWWQIGEVAYALVSSNPETGLADEAETLRNSLY